VYEIWFAGGARAVMIAVKDNFDQIIQMIESHKGMNEHRDAYSLIRTGEYIVFHRHEGARTKVDAL
jgi:hypothetical protein